MSIPPDAPARVQTFTLSHADNILRNLLGEKGKGAPKEEAEADIKAFRPERKPRWRKARRAAVIKRMRMFTALVCVHHPPTLLITDKGVIPTFTGGASGQVVPREHCAPPVPADGRQDVRFHPPEPAAVRAVPGAVPVGPPRVAPDAFFSGLLARSRKVRRSLTASSCDLWRRRRWSGSPRRSRARRCGCSGRASPSSACRRGGTEPAPAHPPPPPTPARSSWYLYGERASPASLALRRARRRFCCSGRWC